MPKGPLRVVYYIFGRIGGQSEELASASQMYPILNWRHQKVSQTDHQTGLIRHSIKTIVKPVLAHGLNFKLERVELWDGSTFHQPDAASIKEAPNAITIDINKDNEPNLVGDFAIDASDKELAYSIGAFIINTNSFAMFLRAIAEIVCVRGKMPGPRLGMRSLVRYLLNEIRRGNRDAELEAMLGKANRIATARRAITEGVLLVGWEGKPTGKPTVEVVVGPSSRWRAPPQQLRREDIRQLVDDAAAIAQELQAWLTRHKVE